MKYNFEELWNRLPQEIRIACDNCEQNEKYHTEGVVTNHIKLVFEYAKKFNDIDILLAAIFHDLGKPETFAKREKNGELHISNIGHELKCKKYIDLYFDLYSDLSDNKDKIIEICENHMKAHLYLSGNMSKKAKREAFEKLTYFNDVIKFTECDSNGRK